MDRVDTNDYRMTVMWILIGVGALGVLCAACIGGGSLLVFVGVQHALETELPKVMEPMFVLMDFGSFLEMGHIQCGYELTTEAFQRRQSLDKFTKFVADHPQLCRPWSETDGGEMVGDSCSYTVTTSADDGQRSTFKLSLRREHGRWKVEAIAFQ